MKLKIIEQKGYVNIEVSSDYNVKEIEVNDGTGWIKRKLVNNSFYIKPRKPYYITVRVKKPNDFTSTEYS